MLLIRFALVLFCVFSPSQIVVTEGSDPENPKQALENVKVDDLWKLFESGKYINIVSALNDYLCKKFPEYGLEQDLEILTKIRSQIKNGSKYKDFNQKIANLANLFDLIKRGDPKNLCINGGINSILNFTSQQRVHQDQLSDSASGCKRTAKMNDYIIMKRKEICEESGFFLELVLKEYATVKMEDRNKLFEVLGDLMNFIYLKKLGECDSSRCRINLNKAVENFEPLRGVKESAGALLLNGLDKVVSEEQRKQLEEVPLTNFANILEEHIFGPCSRYLERMESAIEPMKSYEFIFGSSHAKGEPNLGYKAPSKVTFASGKTYDSIFHRAWALYNVCQLVVQASMKFSELMLEALPLRNKEEVESSYKSVVSEVKENLEPQ